MKQLKQSNLPFTENTFFLNSIKHLPASAHLRQIYQNTSKKSFHPNYCCFAILPTLWLRTPSLLSSSAVWNSPPFVRGKDAGHRSLSFRGGKCLRPVMGSAVGEQNKSTEGSKIEKHHCSSWTLYLPGDEVFETQQFLSVSRMLLIVLISEEGLVWRKTNGMR